jgi:hypothetical protein
MARVPAFQAGYAGSIPVTRSTALNRRRVLVAFAQYRVNAV